MSDLSETADRLHGAMTRHAGESKLLVLLAIAQRGPSRLPDLVCALNPLSYNTVHALARKVEKLGLLASTPLPPEPGRHGAPGKLYDLAPATRRLLVSLLGWLDREATA